MDQVSREFNGYRILVADDPGYIPGSSANVRTYKKVYGSVKGEILVSRHGIVITKDGEEIASAVVLGSAGATVVHQNAFVIKQNKMYICICNHVMCLTLPELDLVWDKALDWSCCFEIYPYKDDFIIHGEESISRIDIQGNQKWEFTGEDVFTEEFLIQGTTIKAEDFENDVYFIDIETGKEKKVTS